MKFKDLIETVMSIPETLDDKLVSLFIDDQRSWVYTIKAPITNILLDNGSIYITNGFSDSIPSLTIKEFKDTIKVLSLESNNDLDVFISVYAYNPNEKLDMEIITLEATHTITPPYKEPNELILASSLKPILKEDTVEEK